MNSKVFENNDLKFYYKENKATELNPLIELYRGKLYLSILKFFIGKCTEKFGTKIFSFKKSYFRTLTNLLSSWLFNLYSKYDFNGDPFLPSNFHDMECLKNTIKDYSKNIVSAEEFEKKINLITNELKNVYYFNLNLLNSYKKSDYYKKNNKKYNLIIKQFKNKKGIEFLKFDMKYSFKIRDKRLFGILDNIILPIEVYNICKNKYNGPNNKLDEYLWITIFRYQLLGSNNHQLGVLPVILNKMTDDFGLKYECFASTINSILPFYCSVFYDVEKYFGSKGSFFNLEPISGTYSFNPPYQADIINKGINKLFNHLDKATETNNILNFIITIPIWDLNGKSVMNNNLTSEIDYGEFNIIENIKNNKHFKGLRMISKENFTYLDHNFNLYKNVTIQNTYVIILSSDSNNNFIEKINEYDFSKYDNINNENLIKI